MTNLTAKFTGALPTCDVLVMCAAVSDYKPATLEPRKMQKRTAPFDLKLIPTRDILASLPRGERNYLVVGFAAETHDLESERAKKTSGEKLRRHRRERCQRNRFRNGK